MPNPFEKELVIKPGSPMTVEQAEDLHRRTGWPITHDPVTRQITVVPQDGYNPETDFLDVPVDHSPPAVESEN